MTPDQKKIVEDNLGLVPYFLWHHSRSLKRIAMEIGQDEATSIAYMSLCKCAMAWDASKGKLSSYYAIAVMGSLIQQRKVNRRREKALMLLPARDRWYEDVREDGPPERVLSALRKWLDARMFDILCGQSAGTTLDQLAGAWGVTRTRVYQLLDRAQRRAKMVLLREAPDLLEDYGLPFRPDPLYLSVQEGDVRKAHPLCRVSVVRFGDRFRYRIERRLGTQKNRWLSDRHATIEAAWQDAYDRLMAQETKK